MPRALKRSLLERLGLRKTLQDEGLQGPLYSDDEGDVRQSICDNIKVMLASHQGEAPAWPDYGLPELAEIVTNIPDRTRELTSRIAIAIARAEPRLAPGSVHVEHDPDHANPLLVRFIVNARLRSDDREVIFETVMAPQLKVEQR